MFSEFRSLRSTVIVATFALTTRLSDSTLDTEPNKNSPGPFPRSTVLSHEKMNRICRLLSALLAGRHISYRRSQPSAIPAMKKGRKWKPFHVRLSSGMCLPTMLMVGHEAAPCSGIRSIGQAEQVAPYTETANSAKTMSDEERQYVRPPK